MTMFKHANAFVPGSKVSILSDPNSKVASPTRVATLENVDVNNGVAFVRHQDGSEGTYTLDRVVPAE